MSIIDVSPIGLPVHHGMGQLTGDEVKRKAFDKLQAFITTGQARAQATVRQIVEQVPTDRVVPVKALNFKVSLDASKVEVLIPGVSPQGMHSHALDQLSERAGIPSKYAHQLNGSPWGRELLAENFRKLVAHGFDAKDRLLTRSVGSEIRGVLSDRYRRIDARPDVDALLGVVEQVGALVVDGSALDTKVALKIALPKPLEIFPGEYMVFGLEYRNSDYGDGVNDWREMARKQREESIANPLNDILAHLRRRSG